MVLLQINNFLQEHVKEAEVKSDLVIHENKFNLAAKVQTLPDDILNSNLRPDIVLTDRVKKIVNIIELTVPFESNIEGARDRKSRKYASVIADFELCGYMCNFYSVEVGSRGVVAHGTAATISHVSGASRKAVRDLLKTLSMTVIRCSHLIFREKDNANYKFDFILS